MKTFLMVAALLLLAGPSLAERTWFMERPVVQVVFLLEEAPSAKVLDQVKSPIPTLYSRSIRR